MDRHSDFYIPLKILCLWWYKQKDVAQLKVEFNCVKSVIGIHKKCYMMMFSKLEHLFWCWCS